MYTGQQRSQHQNRAKAMCPAQIEELFRVLYGRIARLFASSEVGNARSSNQFAAKEDVATLIRAAAALLSDSNLVRVPPIAVTLFLTSGDSGCIDQVFETIKVNVKTLWDRIGKDTNFVKAIALTQGSRKNGDAVKMRLDNFVKERNQVVHGDGMQLVKTPQDMDETFVFFHSLATILDRIVEADALAQSAR